MLKKFIVYLSVYVPIIFIMCARDIFAIVHFNGIQKATNVKMAIGLLLHAQVLPFYITLIVLLIICLFILFLLKGDNRLGHDTVIILNVRNVTAEYYLAYSSLFVLSLSTFSLLSIKDIISLIMLICFLGIVYIKNDLYYINPTINILYGYIYDVEYEYNGTIQHRIVLSKKKLYPRSYTNIVSSDYDFSFVREVNDKTN